HAYAAYLTIVLSCDAQRHGITIVLRFINQLESRRLGQDLARVFYRYRALEFCAYGDRVRTVNGHAHTGDRSSKFRQMHNLATLVLKLHFLLGVTALEK